MDGYTAKADRGKGKNKQKHTHKHIVSEAKHHTTLHHATPYHTRHTFLGGVGKADLKVVLQDASFPFGRLSIEEHSIAGQVLQND